MHLHGLDFASYLPAAGPAVLVTLHLPLAWYPPGALDPRRPGVHFACVSPSQRRSALAAGRPDPAVIENGVDVDRFEVRPREARAGYALALGRVCPEKGLHVAMDAARLAGVELVVAGPVFGYPEHERYFREEIAPRVDASRRYVGAVGLAAKRDLLAGARCLLVPSTAPETSSLVAMEALASGTPVIAFPSGALALIVEHARTGFLAAGVEEMAAAIERAAEVDPASCRRAAVARFSHRAMVAAYLDRYASMTGTPRAASVAPSGEGARVGDGAPGGAARAEIALDRVDDLAALERLADEWSDLHDRCPWATTFQRPEWLLAWWRAFRADPPSAILARRGGRLVGLALLCRYEHAGERRVALAGGGVSDYQDVLADPEHGAGFARAVVETLAEDRGSWDVVSLDPLRAPSPLLDVADPLGLRSEVVPLARCPVLDLSRSAAGLDGAVPAAMLARLTSDRRRGARAGIRVERAAPGSEARTMESLFALHEARWRGRGEPGVLADPRVRRFHEDAASGLAARGCLRLFALVHEGRVAGALHGLCDKGRALYYLSGFDPALGRWSPGTLLVGAAIEDAAREGSREFDFLRGQEPYKYAWGAKDRTSWARRIRDGQAA